MAVNIIYIIINLVKVVLLSLQVCMFGRAVMSWLSVGEEDEENKISKFLFFVTEPIVLPIRNFLNRFDYFNGMPIDLSFIAAVMILYIVYALLPNIVL